MNQVEKNAERKTYYYMNDTAYVDLFSSVL